MNKRPTLDGLDIPRANKGEAAPIARQVSEQPQPVPTQAREGEGGLVRPLTLDHDRDIREIISVRISSSIIDRLRRAAFELRQKKQDVVQDALETHLARLGF
jgi:hypothetical protein